jgi:hypothetical protein
MSSYQNAPQELQELLDALDQPLSPDDIAGGWDQAGLALAKRIAIEAADTLRSGETPRASHHFVRWLDHHGIVGGPLLDLVARAQLALAAA